MQKLCVSGFRDEFVISVPSLCHCTMPWSMTVVPARNWKRHMPTIGSVESDTRLSDAPSLPTSHDCRCSLAFGSASVLLHCAAAVAVSNAPSSTSPSKRAAEIDFTVFISSQGAKQLIEKSGGAKTMREVREEGRRYGRLSVPERTLQQQPAVPRP